MSINVSDHHLYPVPADLAASAQINRTLYDAMYRQSVEQPATFWAGQAREFLSFEKTWDTVVD